MPAAPRTRSSRRIRTVLVADDDEQIRALVWEILAGEGLRVLPARNGQEAIEVLSRHGDGVDVLLADVVMPRMGGRELATAALRLLPGLRVVFFSGYGDNAEMSADFPDAAVLEKPFRSEQLVAAVGGR